MISFLHQSLIPLSVPTPILLHLNPSLTLLTRSHVRKHPSSLPPPPYAYPTGSPPSELLSHAIIFSTLSRPRVLTVNHKPTLRMAIESLLKLKRPLLSTKLVPRWDDQQSKPAPSDEIPSLTFASDEDDTVDRENIPPHHPPTASLFELLHGMDVARPSSPRPFVPREASHAIGRPKTVWWTGYEWVDKKPTRLARRTGVPEADGGRKARSIKSTREHVDEPQKCRLRTEMPKVPFRRRDELRDAEGDPYLKEEVSCPVHIS